MPATVCTCVSIGNEASARSQTMRTAIVMLANTTTSVGADMEAQNTVFEYLYRDAGNFKTYGQLILGGRSPDAEHAIRGCLDGGSHFVAEQIGIPSLCPEHWASVGEGPSDLDHAYHEFVRLRAAIESDRSTAIWGSLEELLARMQGAAGQWDVTRSPNCFL